MVEKACQEKCEAAGRIALQSGSRERRTLSPLSPLPLFILPATPSQEMALPEFMVSLSHLNLLGNSLREKKSACMHAYWVIPDSMRLEMKMDNHRTEAIILV